jgi:hypothetical protein
MSSLRLLTTYTVDGTLVDDGLDLGLKDDATVGPRHMSGKHLLNKAGTN